ncbi:uncharacterized protein [Branchiostoma lanceolatum]|uniref:uncharacterized protein isoform X1 n=2 Tax=Branchiostoma lanceolatum TaxID=7740 RepID=UPI0034515B0B
MKTFLNQYPEVFHIDHKDIVHLVIDYANEKQGVQHTTNQTERKALAHFKEMLSRKGLSATQTISSCYHSCDKDIQVHVVGKKNLKKFFMEYPLMFKVDGNKVMYLNNNRSSEMIANADGMATFSPCEEQDAPNQKSETYINIKCVKDILSGKQSLPLAQLFKELAAMFPQENFKIKDLRLYLKKCPGVFHVNNKDVVEVTPPTNVLVTVQEVADRRCRATLEDGSKVDVFLALYRERMGFDCNSLKYHLSPGDILLVDTERDQPACSMMWVANNIAAVFKSPLDIDVVKHGLKLDMPMPFLPATPTERSPSEICDVIVKLIASSLEVISPLKVDVLSSWMKFLNPDAIMYLREKGGLLQFLQSQPLMFQVQDGCVTLLTGKGEADKENSKCLAFPEAKCVIGEVKTVGNNTAILVLPSRMEATCELHLLTHHSNSTLPLTIGDSVVAYVVPCPGQGTVCWQVIQVKHIIAKAAPKQIQDGRAVVTCSCPNLKEALQQCTKNNDVDALLAWHELLRSKTSISCKNIPGYVQELPKQVRKYTLQKGGPFGFLEQYPTLFHVDRLKVEVSLAQCKQNRSMLDPLNNAFINGGGSEQQQDLDQGLGSLKVQSDGKEKNETADCGVTICTKGNTAGQNQKEQKLSNSTCTSDRYVTVVKNVLAVKENLSILQLVDVLQAMFPKDTFDETSMRLFLKKHPDVFQINLLGVVKEIPPMNALAMVNIVSRNSCQATLEDGSRVYVPIALYRERMAVDCDSLQDHLSYGDVLLVDTERGKRWSSLKWSAKNIAAVFKSSRSHSADAEITRGNLQTPMPFLPATTIERSPSEICDAITRHIAFCLDVRSPLKLDSLSWDMKYLNRDARIYLRAQKGLLSFLQTQPQKFQVEEGNVSLVGKQPITRWPYKISDSRDAAGHFPQEGNTIIGDTFADIGMSMYSEDISTPAAKSTEMEPTGDTTDHGQLIPSEAKCVIGEVKAIDSNMVHLQLPKGQEADLNLTIVQDSINTSCLSVGDCVVAYVVPAPDQSEIPWVVSKVKHVMGKAAPAQIHAKTATATCGSHLLKEVLQQCVLEEEVDTVLTWHRLLSKKTKVLFEEVKGCLKELSKKARMHTLEIGTPCAFLEQYSTLFHVDRAMREVSLVECSPVSRAVFSGGVKRMRTPLVQVEGNTQPVTEKPAVGLMKSQSGVATTDQDAVAFFRGKVLEKGQVSIQVLSSSFGSCPRAIRRHVGSSQKGLVRFLRDHPDTFSLDEDEMVCSVKDTLQAVKEQEKTDHITHIDTAALQGGYELATNAQEDRNDLLEQDISRSICHNWFNPPKSHDSEVKHTVDQIDPVENQEETDEEVDPVDVERETLELIYDLVQRCGEISICTLQGYINLLGEDKQECIKDRGGLLCFLEHDQIFKIDHVSEGISLKKVQETEPDSNSADNEQEHQSTEAIIVKGEVEKTDEPSKNAGSSDIENKQENQHIPIREHGDDTGTSLLTNSIRTEDKHDDVDVSTVVTPSELVTSETNVVIAVSPVQTLRTLPAPDLNQQDQVSCSSSTAVPTATVHPMSVTNDSSVPSTSGTENGHDGRPVGAFSHDLSTESRLNTIPVQIEETGTVAQVSQSSTVEDTNALLPSSAERSADSSQGTQDQTQAGTGSTSVPVQGRPLHLLVGEDGTRVWVNSGQQDMQPLAVFPKEGIVPVANPPGQPDDFTLLLPMFKDNLRPIQDNLVEVEMDIGRIPIARYYSPESPCLLAAIRLSEQTLTRETLETILFALPLERSAIGQGRVLLRGSLHWISTLKNSLGEVVGLTLRRGQAVPGCLDLLWDVVTSGTSTLIVGRPCSGKTTLLREWARVLSDVCYRRVIVVDSLNEIAGGDDIPHPGIGGARRVQVHNRCEQVSQLQTAARNHSPDCIIVDEVQTQEEVTALQAIRLTGIQVVAGVCAGCLTDLLHNSVMRGLLGLSDPPSSISAPPGVSQQPLTFPQTLPVFQAAVTIHNRDTVSVYSDIASFVSVWLLEGRFPLAQHRKRVVTRDRETEL